MALVMTSAYTTPALAAIFAALSTDWRVRLYKTNVTPVDGSVIGDFTEADFVGYSSVNPSWTPGTDGSGDAIMSSDAMNYTFTSGSGSQVVYGYYITDPDQVPEALVGAELFGSSVTFTPSVPSLTLQVIVNLQPEF